MELCDFASQLCFHISFVSFRELKSGTIDSFDPPGAQTSQSVVTAIWALHLFLFITGSIEKTTQRALLCIFEEYKSYCLSLS